MGPNRNPVDIEASASTHLLQFLVPKTSHAFQCCLGSGTSAGWDPEPQSLRIRNLILWDPELQTLGAWTLWECLEGPTLTYKTIAQTPRGIELHPPVGFQWFTEVRPRNPTIQRHFSSSHGSENAMVYIPVFGCLHPYVIP